MTNEIIDRAPDALELQSVPTSELRERLRHALGVTEEAIRTVASIWREMERRGEDMSDIRFALSKFMRPVADGRLLPSLVVAMAGQTRALERVAELPVTEQARLSNGAEIEIYRGKDRIERKSLRSMTYGEVVLTIRDGQIRSPDEQRLAMERSRRPRRARSGRPRRLSITPDGMIRIGDIEIEAERVISVLRTGGLIP